MSEKVRCPSCRGAKKIAKLGGVIGDCNSCDGKGQILQCDKPVMLNVQTIAPNAAIIKEVARAIPAVESEAVEAVMEPVVKVDGKRAIFKHKKS